MVAVAALLAALGAVAQPAAPTSGFTLPPADTLLPRLGSDPVDGIVVRRIVFAGHTAFGQAELDALAAPFVGRALRRFEIEELRQRITRAYIERGYINSGAVIDDSRLAEGTLTLRIVEGVVERVRQSGLQGLSEAYLDARLVRDGERLAHNHLAPAVGSAPVGVDAALRNLVGWGDTLQGSRGIRPRYSGREHDGPAEQPFEDGQRASNPRGPVPADDAQRSSR